MDRASLARQIAALAAQDPDLFADLWDVIAGQAEDLSIAVDNADEYSPVDAKTRRAADNLALLDEAFSQKAALKAR